jgi:hypothetical protein
VSDETRTKVLNAISSLQYFPNAHAVGLRRANGGRSPKSRAHVRSLVGEGAKPPSYPRADSQEVYRQREQLRLLKGEYTRVRRVVTKLSKGLEKLKSIIS